MNVVLSNFNISVQESIYNKNPESSELGKRIIQNSIELLDEIGIDSFMYKKKMHFTSITDCKKGITLTNFGRFSFKNTQYNKG